MSEGTLFTQDSRTGVKYEIPIRRNAIRAVDLQKTRALSIDTNPAHQISHGLRVEDAGLQNTAVVESSISFSLVHLLALVTTANHFSDHERGTLLFRGYTLEQLWDADFEHMFSLLVWDFYPTETQKKDLSRKLAQYMQDVSPDVHRAIQNFPNTTPPLPLILIGLAACLASVPDAIPASSSATLYQTNEEKTDEMILRTVAFYGVVFALARCHRLGIEWQTPSLDQTYYENIFTMSGLVDQTTLQPDRVKLSCFRRFAMLNSDHGMASSVFSALVTASSLTDPISSLISAVASAHGPLHFGATESAQRALREIGELGNVPAFLDDVKAGKRRLFGYGHRSYKGVDPRVAPIRSILEDLPTASNPLYEVAEAIEAAASSDEYFISRGLYPNADFYGNFVFTGIGIEPELIPAAMLTHRIMGIMAHWREHMVTRGKLFRPTHIYTGKMEAKMNVAAKF